MKFSQVFDISLPIDEHTIIYPGNPGVSLTVIPQTTSTHAKITFGSHTGTHIDAPRHVFPDGAGVEAIDCSILLGPCRVLDMTEVKEAMAVEDFQTHAVKKGERILVKTKNSLRGYREFYEDFIYLDGDAADELADQEIILFGTDYLSVKKPGSADARAHTSLLKKNIVIIEGLDLSRITPGNYTLICLPLRFSNLDGSPCRALLLTP